MLKPPVYLDYQATTPTDPRVVEAMLPFFHEKFGNPHSSSHGFGHDAEAGVEHARRQVAELIGASEKEIVFTSGATEANNLAIKGLAEFIKGRKRHIVTCATEHKCVLESCRRLEGNGFEVTVLPVQGNGIIDVNRLSASIRDDTALVSIMAVNNEIGVIQPLTEIGTICRRHGVIFHTDAAQALGKIPLDVQDMQIDLMSLSAHKMYGPKGIGALFVRRRPRVRLVPLIDGGGQERGLRSGTLPSPLCVGFGEACRIAGAEMVDESARLMRLRDRLFDGLKREIAGVILNGDADQRIAGNLNVCCPLLQGHDLVETIDDLALSSGSACASALIEPSYVLRALGLDDKRARSSFRIGLGRYSTAEEVDYAVKRISHAVRRISARHAGGFQAQPDDDLKLPSEVTHNIDHEATK